MFRICLLATCLVGLVHAVTQCSYDSQCEYRCCNYTQEYITNGSCVLIKDEPRCE